MYKPCAICGTKYSVCNEDAGTHLEQFCSEKCADRADGGKIMSDEIDTSQKILTKETAIAMLPDKEFIHTFRGGGMILMGADWERSDIIKAIEKFQVELSGEVATEMGHAIVLEDDSGYLFIETI